MSTPVSPRLVRRARAMTPRHRAGLAAAVAALVLVAASCSSGTGTSVKAAEVTRPAAASTTTVPTSGSSGSTTPGSSSTTSGSSTSTTTPPVKATVNAAPVAVTKVVPHEALYRNGKIYLEGDVPSAKVGDEYKAKAAAVIGAANVVDDYHVNPAAIATTEGKVVIDEPLLFPTGSADLNPAYDNLVELGVIVMRQNPQVTMRITGYTDDVGSNTANYWLSLARAESVVTAISGLGIAPSRFTVVGKGPADPVASNDSDAGRQLNRRIEVELLGLLG